MLAPSKSLKGHRILSVAILVLSAYACSADELQLGYQDLQKSDVLIEALNKGFSTKRQDIAEKLFQNALERKDIKNNWGATAKYFGESALAYPTAKALIGLAEAEAHLSKTADRKLAITSIELINDYLESAIAIDKLQKHLSQPEFSKIRREIDCNKAFISSKDLSENCGYVEVVFLGK